MINVCRKQCHATTRTCGDDVHLNERPILFYLQGIPHNNIIFIVYIL